MDFNEEILREKVDNLIEYFIEEQISPKSAAIIVLRLLAEQMVAANQDRDILQKALNETVQFLSGEISAAYHRFMISKADGEKADG